MLSIDFSNRQTVLRIDERRIARAAEAILGNAGFFDAHLSIVLVDDPTIHGLNRQYLEHDYATDVLSFVLERSSQHLEGEVIVSADMAIRRAGEFGWSADEELLLYVVHGLLHLVGHDDGTTEERAVMRELERRYLAAIGVQPPGESPADRSNAGEDLNQEP
jgi:probable rRNA maturation factor